MIVLFKGIDFENYDRISLPLFTFGMFYKFDDIDIKFYDGIYAIPIKRTEERVIFKFHFIYGMYNYIEFSFVYKINNISSGDDHDIVSSGEIIYENNNDHNFRVQLRTKLFCE